MDELAESLSNEAGKIVVFQGDVSKHEDNEAMIDFAPGGIQTEISTSMGMPNMNGYGRVKTVLGCSPEPGTGEQIASAATFLASDDSSYVSGDILMVDGGWCAM